MVSGNRLNYCLDGGLLIGTDDWLPTSPHEYNWGTFDPRIGCNHLVCGACGQEVRHLEDVVVTDGEAIAPARLYVVSDWLSLPYIEFKPELKGRLYACRCQWHMQFGSTELNPPIPEPEWEFRSQWRCAGHPQFTLPGEIAGVHFNSQTDIESAVRAALAGELGVQPTRLAQIPGYLAIRLYPLLGDVGLGERMGKAVATGLTDPSPEVRRGALQFFYEFPNSPGAEQIAYVARDHRSLFAGHIDPTDPRYDLEEHLLRVLEWRLANVRDEVAIEVVRQELLAGTRRQSLIRVLTAVDLHWVQHHAGDIVKSDPGILKKLIYALREFVDDVVVATLNLLLTQGVVSNDDIQQVLAQAFKSDLDRKAIIESRLLD